MLLSPAASNSQPYDLNPPQEAQQKMTYRGNMNKWIKEGNSLKIKGKLILNGKTIQAFYESSLENPAF